jgi:hypothetical protein
MIVEMHCHTSEHSSCSHVAAVDLVRRACEVGIETIVLTDHHYQWGEDELAEIFLQTYQRQTRNLEADFLAQVDLFKARTCLSILYYFAKIGMGGSEDFWRILVEAERSLAAVATGQGVGSDRGARLR